MLSFTLIDIHAIVSLLMRTCMPTISTFTESYVAGLSVNKILIGAVPFSFLQEKINAAVSTRTPSRIDFVFIKSRLRFGISMKKSCQLFTETVFRIDFSPQIETLLWKSFQLRSS